MHRSASTLYSARTPDSGSDMRSQTLGFAGQPEPASPFPLAVWCWPPGRRGLPSGGGGAQRGPAPQGRAAAQRPRLGKEAGGLSPSSALEERELLEPTCQNNAANYP